LRVEYINPFIESAIQILKQTVTDDIKKENLYLSAKISQISGIAIIVGLAGKVTGRVIILMDIDTSLKIASIMNQDNISELDELAIATLTELANLIVGNAVTKLHNLGYKFDISPPTLVKGNNIKIVDPKLEALVVPLILPQGKIEINLAIKEFN
jgi:chemotaxis protein CheX